MREKNGQTEEVSRRCDKRHIKNQLGSVGTVPEQSQGTGIIPISISGENCVRSNSLGGYDYDGCTPIGKILQRLELVERSYIDYVRADQTRLEARLDESKNLEDLFQQSVAELRQEIYKLATESESNGSGHNNS